MKKKIFGVFLAALFGCMMLAGCKKNVGTPEDNAVIETDEEETETNGEGDSYIFGYSCIDMGNPYFDILKESIRGELEDKGDTLIVKNPGFDAQKQNQQIQEMIEEGVDAVFLCPVDWVAVTPALEALDEAGIPVINIDTQVKEASLTEAYVGSDNKNAGILCGEDLINQYPDGGKVVILECPSQNSINERITGFEEKIKNAGFEVVVREDVGGIRSTAKEAMTRILASNSEIDAIMCGNDQIAMGALEAVNEAGRENIKIYGVDGSPEVKSELLKEGTSIIGTGAQSPINLGKTAAKIGRAILSREDYEKTTYIDTFFINRNNVEMYGTDGWQ